MWNAALGDTTATLANLKTNLAALVTVLNAAFAALPTPRYSAALVGFRIVVETLPVGGDQGSSMAFVTASPDPTNKLVPYLSGANAATYHTSGPSTFATTLATGSDGVYPQPGDYANAFAKA